LADHLANWPLWFQCQPDAITLRTTPDTPAARSAAIGQASAALAAKGVIQGWRDELVSVAPDFGDEELFRIERAATRHFGLMAYASHATGFVIDRGGKSLWISRRAATKSVDPGRLDNLVGGRIAAGFSPSQTMMKEAWEEAGVPVSLLTALKPAAVLRVAYPVPEGLHRETLYAYDLELPGHFTPMNQDGEVASITRMTIPDTIEAILSGEFTLDAGAVTVDFLLRHGHLQPTHADLAELRALLACHR
jgi:8-oxo-dGTP pyrophosphatase MutT (NUDIX family)